ncbi:MAG: type II toxin-antitoxin system HipA family toxin [Sulfurisoma sp.]|nr:type II toxin-antitoxin system HipA family toxin [Sulfurisoma sp.]
MRSTIEIFLDGQWVPAAEFSPMGKAPCGATFEYRIDYVFGPNPVPVSLAYPVMADRLGVDGDGVPPPCPAFLLDLVPQGRGRKYLARELNVADNDSNDLFLAQHGAFNPIGNLRLDTAFNYYRQHVAKADREVPGFTLKDILSKQDEFLDHIWIHSMLTAGTTGVQGAAPKFLLAQDADDLWYADTALRDELAAKHWLVKLPRGSDNTDYAVLRNEAAYLRVAEQCGLRGFQTWREPEFHQNMLFLPRFDRIVQPTGLQRLHQESLASVAGLRGFGLPASLFDLTEAIRRHVTHPVAEAIEFIKRDILNLAMRNTDNHARNTAIQRLPDGTVQLTPVFDFAPMYLDREFIVRGCKWKNNEGREIADWNEIIATLGFEDQERQLIANAVKKFQPVVESLLEIMKTCGVDNEITEECKRNIDNEVTRLEKLKGTRHGSTPKAF